MDDVGKLIADNFDKVLVLISALCGTSVAGIIGIITYALQRKSVLDDQRRQERRNRINSFAEKFFDLRTRRSKLSLDPNEAEQKNLQIEMENQLLRAYSISGMLYELFFDWVFKEEGKIDVVEYENNIISHIAWLIKLTYVSPPMISRLRYWLNMNVLQRDIYKYVNWRDLY